VTDEFYNQPCNIATTSLFNAIDGEKKELLARSILEIIRRREVYGV
jgi:hypothetical protein